MATSLSIANADDRCAVCHASQHCVYRLVTRESIRSRVCTTTKEPKELSYRVVSCHARHQHYIFITHPPLGPVNEHHGRCIRLLTCSFASGLGACPKKGERKRKREREKEKIRSSNHATFLSGPYDRSKM